MLKNKERDMGRSVLPSTARKAARYDKRAANKQYRASVRNAIASFDGEDIEESLIRDGRRRSNMGWMRSERRGADKIAPLVRWAEAKVADLPMEDRECYIRKVLPDGIIGDHAWTHVKYSDAFDMDPVEYFWRLPLEERMRRHFITDCKKYEKWSNVFKFLTRNEMLEVFFHYAWEEQKLRTPWLRRDGKTTLLTEKYADFRAPLKIEIEDDIDQFFKTLSWHKYGGSFEKAYARMFKD